MLDKCYKLLTDASPKDNGLVLEVPKTKPASINLYDSMYHGRISMSIKKKIASLLF